MPCCCLRYADRLNSGVRPHTNFVRFAHTFGEVEMLWLIGSLLYISAFGIAIGLDVWLGLGPTTWTNHIFQSIFSNFLMMAGVFGLSFLFNRRLPTKKRAAISFLIAACAFFLLITVVTIYTVNRAHQLSLTPS